MDRRRFIQTAAAGLAATTVAGEVRGDVRGGQRPAAISSANGLKAIERAAQMMREGSDTLEAAIAGVNLVEGDPGDRSVGYGGLPNEAGVVQLDSSVMHGPSRGAGAVAAIEDVMYPSRVAKQVMEQTDHVLLVGRGASEFAFAMGHEKVDLLTPEAREIWMRWKRSLSDRDDWIDPAERLPEAMSEEEKQAASAMVRTHGTINLNTVNEKGELSGVTTTSGLSFKIPGRVGDSPIIGAGLYVDNDVGAAGSTGRGEANIKTCAAFMVVEFMRQGLSPEEAGLRVLKRIAENTTEPYLLDDAGRPRFNVNFYAINKKGEFAGTAIWSRSRFAAHDGSEAKLYDSAYLFERPPRRR